MKKLLSILLLISSIAFAQQTPESCLEKAKPYLAKDACNTTGIAWVKGALKLDSNNAEAERLLKQCADGKLSEAMATLRQDPGNKLALGVLSRYEPKYPSEELYYMLAKGYSQQNTGAVITKYISKAIESNPNNEEYRNIRYRSNMRSNSSTDNYKQAASDMEYLINNGINGADVYYKLYSANVQGAFRAEEVNANDEALKFYNQALLAGKKVLELEPSYPEVIDLNYLKKNIAELKQS